MLHRRGAGTCVGAGVRRRDPPPPPPPPLARPHVLRLWPVRPHKEHGISIELCCVGASSFVLSKARTKRTRERFLFTDKIDWQPQAASSSNNNDSCCCCCRAAAATLHHTTHYYRTVTAAAAACCCCGLLLLLLPRCCCSNAMLRMALRTRVPVLARVLCLQVRAKNHKS